MNRFKIVVLLLAILLLMSSCSQNITSGDGSGTTDSGASDTGTLETPGNTENPSTPPEKNYEDGTYTLMIYMCGSNLESRSGSATKNIAEMLSAEMPENTKVIIQTGGAKKWRNYGISASHSSRYELRNGELVLIEQNPNVNMGLSSSLEAFLLWGEENYPAEHRSVIFWDHGGGSMKGVAMTSSSTTTHSPCPKCNPLLPHYMRKAEENTNLSALMLALWQPTIWLVFLNLTPTI